MKKRIGDYDWDRDHIVIDSKSFRQAVRDSGHIGIGRHLRGTLIKFFGEENDYWFERQSGIRDVACGRRYFHVAPRPVLQERFCELMGIGNTDSFWNGINDCADV
jgi:hypothetical protein